MRGSALVRLPAGVLRPSLVSGVRFLGSFGLPLPKPRATTAAEGEGAEGEGEAWTGPEGDAQRPAKLSKRPRGEIGPGDTGLRHETKRERRAARRAQEDQCEGTEGENEQPEGCQVVDVFEDSAEEKEQSDLWIAGEDGGPSSPSGVNRVSLRARLLEGLALPRLGLPEVAFLGRSNVGKSSLLNALCRYTQAQRHRRASKAVRGASAMDFARVSRRPGSTRSINLYEVFGGAKNPASCAGVQKKGGKSRGGARVAGQAPRAKAPLTSSGDRGLLVFADLPGYGFTRGLSAQESQRLSKNVRLYVEKRNELRLFLILVDGRAGIQDHDADLLRWLVAQSVPTLLVVTKADCLAPKHLDNLLNQLSFYPKLFSLPPLLQRLKAAREEPPAVKRFNYVSPALLSAARVSEANGAPARAETAERQTDKDSSSAWGSEGETPGARGAATDEGAPQDETNAGAAGEAETPSASASREKRVGVMHGLEGEEGQRIRRQEAEEAKKNAARALPAIEGFRAPGKRSSKEEGPIQVLLTSAAAGQGIAELWKAICEACSGVRAPQHEGEEDYEDGDEESEEREEGSEEREEGSEEREEGKTEEEGIERSRVETKTVDGSEKIRKIRKKQAKKEPFWGFGM
ncbi:GTP-binding conserved hypothetical domain-containing protein [Neospora caninum Liverpool]|nr:GTP-binding conserved hypothetical domain-containing protein [Neospora caninum Liverpool]CBZ52745.1 GTP-binding conserved hypothetical domain-containing protein [Neospora caninum Liverpool]|eukprot:XP_003882777.1 GTP-binding conserved hypothetical domain-containing protein [Neospora caninum Liverpool]